MCTHFIHQCAAAQNDGNAKTNDDVCLSSARERERGEERGERASERELPARWKKPFVLELSA